MTWGFCLMAGVALTALGINGVRHVARTPGGALFGYLCAFAGLILVIVGLAGVAHADEAGAPVIVWSHDPPWALPLLLSVLVMIWATVSARPAARWLGLVAIVLIALIWVMAFGALIRPAAARDDGRYAVSPLKPWFDTLRSGKGPCCSDADGTAVSDVDWDSAGGHYRVRLDDEWIVVPDDALVTEPNRVGRAMVWPFRRDGKVEFIRCFMPGSMT